MGARGLGRHIGHLLAGPGAKRSAGRGQDDPLDSVALVFLQHLEDGIVLAIDRDQPAAAFVERP